MLAQKGGKLEKTRSLSRATNARLDSAHALPARVGAAREDVAAAAQPAALLVRRARDRVVVRAQGRATRRPPLALRPVRALRAAQAEREELRVPDRDANLHLLPAERRHNPRPDVGVVIAPAYRARYPFASARRLESGQTTPGGGERAHNSQQAARSQPW